jgi:hypothetical protein
MNSLTKVLLEDLLEADTKKITAIYGGGFKPPTKGHFDVVQKAAEQNPEIDEFIIYVGGGVRDGIAQAESVMIWELYKKYLPLKVRIEPVKSPVGDILRYAKEHPEEEVLWVIGARENNPEDFTDIASRTRTLDKYPNLELRVIQTSGGVSGTAARKAVRDNNKEQFFHLIPDIEEKDQVWDIVSPLIKENIFKDLKGVLKSIWSKGGKLTQDIIDGAKREGKETSKLIQLLNKMLYGDSITNDEKTFMKAQGKDLLKILPLVAIQGIPLPIPITPLLLVLGKKFGFNILPDSHEIMPLSNLAEVVTATEIICDNCGWEWDIKDGGDDLYICHKCGHDNTPKQLNEGRYDSISRQLASYTLKGWKDDASHNEPTGRVEFEVGPGKDLEYGDLEFLYKGVAVFAGIQTYSHNGYAKLKSGEIGVTYSIPKSMIPQGWEEIYMDLISTIRHEIEHLTQGGVNLKPGKEILDLPLRRLVTKHPDTLRYLLLPSEKDANVQGLYLKAKKWRRPYSEVVDEYIRDFLKITNKNDVNILKGMYDKRAKELNLPAIQENDPFGIKAYARELVNEALKDTWNPEESFVSLSKFMIDKGMNIQPLPKVKIISNDEENASNLLGKTAYYNPNDKSITLYTKDRHPKDICRSFTHEMVHHEQNLEDRLNNINTTNTNEDGALPEIEKEAYEKGNMMFRNWEDSIKNV